MNRDQRPLSSDLQEMWRPAHTWVLLTAIVAVGLFLRCWGLRHGLPYVYNPDEHFEVYRALGLGRGNFNLDGRLAKGGFFYLLFVEFGVYYTFMLITGKLNSAYEFARSIVDDPSGIWLIGRATAAAIGTINIYVVYRIGLRVGGGVVGLCAAYILAVAHLPVALSHDISVDVPMTCLTSVALLYALRIYQQGSLRDYILAGVLVGLAAMNKLPAVLTFAPIGLAHLFRGVTPPVVAWLKRSAVLLGASAFAFSLVYVAGNPGILWNLGEVLRFVFTQFTGDGQSGEISIDLLERHNTWLFYFAALARALGVPLLGLCILGLAMAFVLRDRATLVLSTFVVVFYLALAMSRSPDLIYERYVLPMIPPLVVLGSVALVRGLSAVRLRHIWRLAAVAILTAGLAIPTMLDSIAYDWLHARTDTRTLAKQWIERNIPAGTRVFMRGNPEENSQLTIPLESTVANLERMAVEHANDNPGKALYLGIRADLAKTPAYDVVTAQIHESWPTWEECRERGVELIALRGAAPRPDAELPMAVIPRSRADFDRALGRDPHAMLVAVFDPIELRCPGPSIRIYAIDRDGEHAR